MISYTQIYWVRMCLAHELLYNIGTQINSINLCGRTISEIPMLPPKSAKYLNTSEIYHISTIIE